MFQRVLDHGIAQGFGRTLAARARTWSPGHLVTGRAEPATPFGTGVDPLVVHPAPGMIRGRKWVVAREEEMPSQGNERPLQAQLPGGGVGPGRGGQDHAIGSNPAPVGLDPHRGAAVHCHALDPSVQRQPGSGLAGLPCQDADQAPGVCDSLLGKKPGSLERGVDQGGREFMRFQGRDVDASGLQIGDCCGQGSGVMPRSQDRSCVAQGPLEFRSFHGLGRQAGQVSFDRIQGQPAHHACVLGGGFGPELIPLFQEQHRRLARGGQGVGHGDAAQASSDHDDIDVLHAPGLFRTGRGGTGEQACYSMAKACRAMKGSALKRTVNV